MDIKILSDHRFILFISFLAVAIIFSFLAIQISAMATYSRHISCGDGICNIVIGENFRSCPEDCKTYGKDNICNPINDSGCDWDCLNVDPDCR